MPFRKVLRQRRSGNGVLISLTSIKEDLVADQEQNSHGGSPVNNETSGDQTTVPSSKRKFIEPQISQPVDVLEATTFFQAVGSGATN